MSVTIIELDPVDVKTKYESNSDTNAFTDAEQSKLLGIEDNATADQTGAEIVAAIDTELGGSGWQSGSTSIPGPYDDHAAAATAGVGVGYPYRISENNAYGIVSPGGMTVVVRTS